MCIHPNISRCWLRHYSNTWFSDLHSWSEYLPIVLSGCRTATKSDLYYSSADILYGANLALPETIVAATPPSPPERASYVTRLWPYFGNLVPMSLRCQTISSYVPSDINSWTYVFCTGPFYSRTLAGAL